MLLNQFIESQLEIYRELPETKGLSEDVNELAERVISHQMRAIINIHVKPSLSDVILDADSRVASDWRDKLGDIVSEECNDPEIEGTRKYLFGRAEEGVSYQSYGSSILGHNIAPALVQEGVLLLSERKRIWSEFGVTELPDPVVSGESISMEQFRKLKEITSAHFKLSDDFICQFIHEYITFICEKDQDDLPELVIGDGDHNPIEKEFKLDNRDDIAYWLRSGFKSYFAALTDAMDQKKALDNTYVLEVIKRFSRQEAGFSLAVDKGELVRVIIALYASEDRLDAIECLFDLGLESQAIESFSQYTIQQLKENSDYIGFFDASKYRDVLLKIVTSEQYQYKLFGVLEGQTRRVLNDVLLKGVDDVLQKIGIAMYFGDVDYVCSLMSDQAGATQAIANNALKSVTKILFDGPLSLAEQSNKALQKILASVIRLGGQSQVSRETCYMLAVQFIESNNVEGLKSMVEELAFDVSSSFPATEASHNNDSYSVSNYLILALIKRHSNVVNYLWDKSEGVLSSTNSVHYLRYALTDDQGCIKPDLSLGHICNAVESCHSDILREPFIANGEGEEISLLEWAINGEDDLRFEVLQYLTKKVDISRISVLGSPFFNAVAYDNKRALLQLADMGIHLQPPSDFEESEKYTSIYQLYLISNDIISKVRRSTLRGVGVFRSEGDRQVLRTTIFKVLLDYYHDDPDLGSTLERDLSRQGENITKYAEALLGAIKTTESPYCCGLLKHRQLHCDKPSVERVAKEYLQKKYGSKEVLTIVDNPKVGRHFALAARQAQVV